MALAGVHYAKVTQNKDDEGLGRVKIQLPWLDNGTADQTAWALIAAPMGGDKFGWYTLPEVGDIVAVMFLSGDIAHPVVLGGVWSKTDTPPETNEDGKNDFHGFKSRAGARFVMDDSSKGKVYFADKSDKNVLVIGDFSSGGSGGNAKGASTPAPISGSPSGGVSLCADSGKLDITAKGKLNVEAQNIEITSKTDVDVNAGGNANLKGGLGNVNAGSGIKAEGSQTKIN
ncbi:MAG: hypothetical protein H6709_20845 [Kofleriaceae bacterium]|nr:hypothetical protein [Kofleriaceae bacterium]